MTEIGDTSAPAEPPAGDPASAQSPSAPHPHRWLVRGLLVLATVIAIVGVLSVWANRQLFNADNWADTSSEMVQDPAVQAQLAGYLVDQLYTNVDVPAELAAVLPPRLAPLAGPAANSLRGLAETAMKRLLARPRVQDLWHSANRVAAAQFIAITKDESDFVKTNGDTVTLDLREMLLSLAQRLGFSGNLISKLPESAGQLEAFTSSDVSTVQNGASGIRGLSVILPILAFGFWGLAVWLARGRRRLTLLWVGVDMILAGVVVLVARNWAGNSVVDSLASAESVKPAVRSVWEIGSQMLVDVAQALIIGGIPVVGAALLAGPSAIATACRRTLAPAFREHPGAVYAVAAAIVALVVLWEPIPATHKPLPLLFMVGLFAFGIEVLRRQTAEEFPPESTPAGKVDFSIRAGRAAAATRGRFARPAADPLERLDHLSSLHDRHVITDAEFEVQKAAILSGRA